MSRSINVVVLAVLQFLNSILLIHMGRFGIDSSDIVQGTPSTPLPLEERLLIIILSIIMIVFGLVGLWLAYQLFRMKRRAWLITLVMQSIQFLYFLTGILVTLVATGKMPLILIVYFFPLVIICYLLRPNIKRAFGY